MIKSYHLPKIILQREKCLIDSPLSDYTEAMALVNNLVGITSRVCVVCLCSKIIHMSEFIL